jgi:2-isopropylmalate synthase
MNTLPEAVGNHRKVLVSDQAGRSNVMAELDRAGISYEKSDPKLARLVEELKEREACGLCVRVRQRLVRFAGAAHARPCAGIFQVEQFDVNVEQRYNAKASGSRWRLRW